MMNRFLSALFALLLLAGGARVVTAQQTVTLHVPTINEKVYDSDKATFSFEHGVRGKVRIKRLGLFYDLGYGFMAINDEDWFTLSPRRDDRSVIKDLGALNWFESFKVPVLTPLPELEKGQERTFSVDTSGDTGKKWAQTTTIHAKAVVGHMYVVRVKRPDTDFYALFRVEELEQRASCRITWSVIPTPEP
jgi:hypothetical protein